MLRILQTFCHEGSYMFHQLVSSKNTSFPSPDLHKCHQHLGCSFPKNDQQEDKLIPSLASQQKTLGVGIYPRTLATEQQIPLELL